MVVTMFSSFTLSANAETTGTSGTTGDCTWTLEDTRLTISGNGGMADYSNCGPWGKNITELVIENGVTSIGAYAFYFCSKLESVTIPGSVTTIGRYAFSYCSRLKDLDIPKGVTGIGYTAFGACSALESISLPDSLTSISDSAFENCSVLSGITIPAGVTEIGECVLRQCDALTSITVAEGNPVYHASGNCLIKTAEKILVQGCNGSVIPTDGSVTVIGDSAFEYCKQLENITIPDNVTAIGFSAFYNCDSLQSLTIPKSVLSIDSYAFGACTGLTSITVEEGNPVYHASRNCLIETESKTLIQGCNQSILPTDGSITSIGDDAFSYCTNLMSITIPDGVTSIGSNAFYRCSNISTIKIPDSVTSIGSYAFWKTRYYDNTANWKNGILYIGKHLIVADRNKISSSITVKDGTLTIANNAFSSCGGITGVTLPDGLISIGARAFYDCRGMKDITIPDSVTSIGNHAFSSCANLEAITIPDSVRNIGYRAFNGTKYYDDASNWEDGVLYIGRHLVDADPEAIPSSYAVKDGTLTIAEAAFKDAVKISGITIPDSVISIREGVFGYCVALVSIDVEEGNPAYHSDGNCLIKTADKILLQGCNTSVIPTDGSVTAIGDYAFLGSIDLKQIIIPNSVTKIGYGAFGYCQGLEKITIPDSVTQIGLDVFYECSDDLVICGNAGSYAEKYAAANALTFAACEHTDSHVDGAIDATCTKEGYTGDTTCNDCGAVIYGKTIPKTTHQNKTTTTKATTSKNGSVVTKCTVCGNVESNVTIAKIATIRLSKTAFTYNGKAQKPAVTVKDSKGKALKAGSDYTVVYSAGCKAVGQYTVTVTFKGNYSGTKKLTFAIMPKGTSLSKLTAGKKQFTAGWKKQSSQTTGYQIQYSTSKNMKSAKTATISKVKTTSATVKGLKASKTYYVRIRTYKTVKGTKIYSAWSGTKNVKVKK